MKKHQIKDPQLVWRKDSERNRNKIFVFKAWKKIDYKKNAKMKEIQQKRGPQANKSQIPQKHEKSLQLLQN